ncbi:MAG: DUF898 family protein [Candidatus Sericytochromatia bacterium]|nr:DUF898 family protein [Candidatus Sericytochromatia bacterium]
MECPACLAWVEPPRAQCDCGAVVRGPAGDDEPPSAVAAPSLPAEPSAEPASPARKRRKGPGRLRFRGEAATLLKLQLVNLGLTLVTLGIYRFWARARRRRYLYGQLSLQGHRFAYHGTGEEGLHGFAKLAGIALAMAVALMGLALGLQVGLTAGLGMSGKQAAQAGGAAMNLVGCGLSLAYYPLVHLAGRKYQLSRTSLNGVRFSFRGTYGEAFRLHVGRAILTMLTMGCYAPWYIAAQQRWATSRTYYGSQAFDCDLTGRQLAGPILLGVLLLPLTLGLSAFWIQAAIRREAAAATRFGQARFQDAVTGWGLLRWTALGVVAGGITAGLALPWVQVRSLAYRASCVTVKGPLGLEDIRQEALEETALGEVFSDDAGLDGLAI